MTYTEHAETTDRRVRRTRAAIVSAFNRMILAQGYASLRPGDVAGAADVGRSTFYEHFRGLDDLLSTTLEAVLLPMARSLLEAHPSAEAHRIVEHVWDNRRLANILFNGEARPVVLRAFATQFESAIESMLQTGGCKLMLSSRLIALHLAAGQLALLGEWISGRSEHSAREVATALHASGRACITALIVASEA